MKTTVTSFGRLMQTDKGMDQPDSLLWPSISEYGQINAQLKYLKITSMITDTRQVMIS